MKLTILAGKKLKFEAYYTSWNITIYRLVGIFFYFLDYLCFFHLFFFFSFFRVFLLYDTQETMFIRILMGVIDLIRVCLDTIGEMCLSEMSLVLMR